ncbi:MAG: hypothetical protein CMO01_03590 [Thalassobius sp.]|nr:hypothetical protein [Thalassovita sp.]
MTHFQSRTVKTGHWLYNGELRKGIILKAINYDYWYEIEKEDGLDMDDDKPILNEEGEMYMIDWV